MKSPLNYHRNHCEIIVIFPFTISFFVAGKSSASRPSWPRPGASWRSLPPPRKRVWSAAWKHAWKPIDFTISFWKVSMICNGKSLHRPIFLRAMFNMNIIDDVLLDSSTWRFSACSCWVTLSGLKVQSDFKRDETVNLNNLVCNQPWIWAKLRSP